MSLSIRLLRLALVIVLSFTAGLALSVWVSDWIGGPVAVFCIVYGSRIAWSGFDEDVSRAERYQPKQQVECGLRVVEGAQPGLGTRFKHGVASLEPGVISFGHMAGGFRFLRHKPVRITVVTVDRSDQRSVRFVEQFSARPGFRVIKVLTGTATLEWVLPPEQTAWAAQQIRPK